MSFQCRKNEKKLKSQNLRKMFQNEFENIKFIHYLSIFKNVYFKYKNNNHQSASSHKTNLCLHMKGKRKTVSGKKYQREDNV